MIYIISLLLFIVFFIIAFILLLLGVNYSIRTYFVEKEAHYKRLMEDPHTEDFVKGWKEQVH